MTTLQHGSPTIHLIGVANSLGCKTPQVAQGPAALMHAGLADLLRSDGMAAAWLQPIEPLIKTPKETALADVAECTAAQVERSLTTYATPVVIGGDHSTALGTWRGVARSLHHKSSLGLLWIDAHLDAHTPSSSPTGNLHGMPIALLMGHGIDELTRVRGPKLAPEHIVVFGARSWESEEHERLSRLGVRIYTMQEIEHRGFEETFHEAIDRLRGFVDHIGLSIDIDALSLEDAPFTTTPCPGGLDATTLCHLLAERRRDFKPIALEIVEYVPTKDQNNAGVRLIKNLIGACLGPTADSLQAAEMAYGAHNYSPMPVVFERGQGVWLYDVHGKQVLDMLSAYSAVSFGHCAPRLVAAMTEQAQRLTLTSRAVSNNKLPLMLERLCSMTGMDCALPVNTGLEAVETALKAARKWGYTVKGIPANQAEIISCEGNFHGRSTMIVGMSSEEQYKSGFGPFPAGLKRVRFGDVLALERAITPNTCAFIVEPIQGEGGIIVPPPGYLQAAQAICEHHKVLLIVDEVQTGLGRTGALLACDHEHVHPDGLILGKALGGGLYPVSAFLAKKELMDVFTPGDHGSTFGGNPLGSAIAMEALAMLEDEQLIANAASLGHYFIHGLRSIGSPLVRDIRGRGLLIGVELENRLVNAHDMALELLKAGILTKDTHGATLRFAPPLIIDKEQIDWALDVIETTFTRVWKAALSNNAPLVNLLQMG